MIYDSTLAFVDFADPPNLSRLSLNDAGPTQPQEELDQPPPTTLLEWAVLILNTSQPQLKVHPAIATILVQKLFNSFHFFRLTGLVRLLPHSVRAN